MSRPAAIGVAVGFAILLLLVLARFTVAATNDQRELVAAAAVRHEFGTGQLAGCFMAIIARETGGTFDPRTANRTDRHADGSTGSFGLTQVGALWRAPGESVEHFALRMFNPRQNLRLAHQLYRKYGITPWRTC